MKVKEWKYDQIMEQVTRYGDLWMNLDVKRNDNILRNPLVENGYVEFTCRVDVLKETEKAVYVNLGNSFKTWIPKSAIAA